MKKLYNNILPLAIGFYFNVVAIFSKEGVAQKAFTLFCTPRKGKVLKVQSSFLEAAKHDVVTVGGKQLQTYCWPGKKETVLLIHGWESNSFRWRNLIGLLQDEGYEIIAFDAPAHGNSSGSILNVPLYAECTQHVIQRFNPNSIVGHSVGGMTAVYHQYLYPNSTVQKIVTVGSPSELHDIMLQYKKILGFNNRVLGALDDYFKKHFGFGIHGFSTANFAKNITIPGLLIHDELDTIAPVKASEKVHASWKNSTLIKTSGLGHSMHQSAVSEQIINFLKS
ncbi:MAG: alpha/beta hydrolase [Eudoraea sp.]|nr:alpha/beta hydrolase [Muriicola sp.]NNE04063.1 alpha/beta hydrolase [Eudoraea sp.]